MSNNPTFQPADRVSEIKEYYFSQKIAEVARLRSEGRNIISVAIGGPDRPPHHSVIETLCRQAERPDNHSYQNTRSIPELRNAFARWYLDNYSVHLNPDTEILPLIGSKEGILHISMTFLNKGDKVLIPNPGYPTYTSATKLLEAEPLYYTLSEANSWQPDFDQLEQLAAEDNIKLMWVNYPHMPTGAPASHETFKRLVNFGRRHSIIIAHDNPYSFILNDNPISILEIEGAREVCIEMNSLSKSHNMAGWRVAMLASNPTFVSWVLRVKSNIDSGQFKPLMLAAADALYLPKQWYAELNSLYRQRRLMAEKIMHGLGCTFDPRQQGLFLWGRIPDSVPSGEWLADKLLYEAGIFLTPGFIFGSQGDRYIRLSLCADLPALQETLNRVNKFIQSNPPQA